MLLATYQQLLSIFFTGCAIGYMALMYPFLSHVNTQLVEQNNSKLKKLKSSLSYMNPDNFMDTLNFFLCHCNENCKKKAKHS